MGPERWLGVDVGGTFTDFVSLGAGGLTVVKRLSTPAAPERSVVAGLADLDPGGHLPVAHGTTVATNALLTGRGARVALVTTAGFGDVLRLGRGDRADLYALAPRPRPSLVPPECCIEVDERVGADGRPVRRLTPAALRAAVDGVRRTGADAAAVCLLFSFLYPDHERALGDALRVATDAPGHVSLSLDVLPEIREYERASTVAVNAYVGPVVTDYLARLTAALAPRVLTVMGSHAGTLPAPVAARLPVTTILSGPAAGVLGALAVARRAGAPRIMTCDMGGTSTDVALCDDAVPYTGWTAIQGYPVHRPSVAVHTIGAGGGSVVGVDAGGALRVGPASAGADPGPAAYGRGGRLPTLTDAHVVIGRLRPGARLAGGIRLDAGAARAALAPLAAALGTTAEAVAWGAVRVANAAMERALRQVSVEQGHHPRDFVLVPFGGAGPLHACELAEALGMRRVLVPAVPGALSAVGLATAAPTATASRSVLRAGAAGVEARDAAAFEPVFQALEAEARAMLPPADRSRAVARRLADLRYAGQSWEITVPWPAGADPVQRFEAAHHRRHGYARPAVPVEVVTLRVQVAADAAAPLPPPPALTRASPLRADVMTSPTMREAVAAHVRTSLAPGAAVRGPCILSQADCTTWVAPGWQAVVGAWGDLELSPMV
ncbi:hypothetical protein DCC79_05400 [bacterium]|nr:MAG: hypothetical protein DCC79_05400 [bacterium]